MQQTAGNLTTPPPSCGGQPPLCGRYKTFFKPEHHATVSKWYHQDADHAHRQTFKRLVKAISHFDIAEAKAKVRIGFNLDIPAASAIIASNGGDLMTDEAREKAVVYVAAAKPAEKQIVRDTFGRIVPPSLTCLHRSKQRLDFDEDRKFMKGELMHRDTAKKVIAAAHLNPPSVAVQGPCQVIGDGKSQYGLFYAWKTAPKLGANVQQRAHESSVGHGAPWGEYGSAEVSRWKTHQKEDMEEREYGSPTTELTTIDGAAAAATGGRMGTLAKTSLPKRRFQNYNDNVSHEIYRTQRLLRKGRELPGSTVIAVNDAAAADPNLMKPQRPDSVTRAFPVSPIFGTVLPKR